ncbi:LysR family transcriptional regulator [Pectobacterium peruviense]|uniref:LysR family transcriptional regulator n=1 Tax=Pectobacterium peruviense TaxID=2066479 RepID=A0ABX4S6N5_9GAMM|nr:LysR family transcriptional regulator [Pectobacterium peruviense]KML66074.1 LysR family transcriptional regulator [Pectobacterium peruviense]PKX83621.1 LysR family transcriptional regulator [Pectobacterium peruviense]PKX86159.1 LysR family transcriptional regulator [Pectobacterium peruviense]
MDLRRFVTFKTIVEEGSFAQAARKLCCTQSTVTFQIQQLEQELSIQLFEKIGRRMALTSAGKSLLPQVHELTRVLDGIRQVSQCGTEIVGELRVMIGETLLAYKMPEVLRHFRLKAPKVHIYLQSVNCYTIRDSLLSDNADLGVFYRVGNDEALHMENFGQQELVLVASPELEDVDFTQHNQHIPVSFIINEPQCIFRQMFESTLRERKITIDSTIELWSIESIKNCVAGNLGVSFLPRFSVVRELESGELKTLPFTEHPLTITALCAYHAGRTVSPAMKTFLECMRQCLGNEPSA